MFKNQNNIIIVDNNPDHIITLKKVFVDNFIKCETFEYDYFSKNQEPLKDIRIAFFDVNLADVPPTNTKAIYNDLANALNEFISPENGLYALVFWTQNKDLVNDFIEYINLRRPETPKPFNISIIDKHEFLNQANGNLFDVLKNIINQPSINLLFDFENHVKNVATKTINELYNIIPNTSWGDNDSFNENFDSIFSKIAIGALGYEHAKQQPDKAIYEALMPLVSNNAINSIESNLWKAFLVKLSESKKNSQPNYPVDFKFSKLNSIFHIDYNRNQDIKGRGVVIQINNNKRFENLFAIPYNDWYSRLMPGLSKAIRNESKPIAIEISASCDFSQLKPRAHKYLLGILVKSVYKENLNKDKIPQSLFILDGTYDIDGEDWFFSFNLNYAFYAIEEDEIFQDILFSLKKEITDMIGNRYANHISRIGITSF